MKLTSRDSALQDLDLAVQERQVLALVGGRGSGKKALADYWIRTRLASRALFQPEQIAVVPLKKLPDVPMDCILLSRLWHELQRLARPSHVLSHKFDVRDVKLYRGRALAGLHLEIIEVLAELHCRAVVLLNAHLLDQSSLDTALDLRSYYDRAHGLRPKRGMVLVVDKDDAQGRGHKVLNLLDTVEEAQQIEVPDLTATDFVNIISELNHAVLQAEFHPAIDARRASAELWKLSGGNWPGIWIVVEQLDAALGHAAMHEVRMITQEGIDRVKQRIGQRIR